MLSTVLLVAGLLALSYPVWTDVFGEVRQDRLATALAAPAARTAYRSGTVQVGDGLTRLQVDRIGLDVVVVQGTSTEAPPSVTR